MTDRHDEPNKTDTATQSSTARRRRIFGFAVPLAIVGTVAIGLAIFGHHHHERWSQQFSFSPVGTGFAAGQVVTDGTVRDPYIRSVHQRKGGRGRFFGGMKHRLLGQADANGDGSVSKDELHAFIGQEIKTFDQNGDQALSRDEMGQLLLKQARPTIRQWHARLDDNEDGALSAQEINLVFDRMFNRMDRDGDGNVTSRERRGRR